MAKCEAEPSPLYATRTTVNTPSLSGFLSSNPLVAEQEYSHLRRKLVAFFRKYHCEDPENLTDETIERALERISMGADTTAGASAYCFGIARNIVLENWKRPKTDQLSDDHHKILVHHQGHREIERGVFLRECLALLSSSDRNLLFQYYLDDRSALAGLHSLTPSALRVKVCRVKAWLKGKVGLRRKSAAAGITEFLTPARASY